MKYENLTDEAKEVLKGMVEYCINHRLCMGMDEGYKTLTATDTDKEHSFVLELRKFSETEDNQRPDMVEALQEIVAAFDQPDYGDREDKIDMLFDPIEKARELLKDCK